MRSWRRREAWPPRRRRFPLRLFRRVLPPLRGRPCPPSSWRSTGSLSPRCSPGSYPVCSRRCASAARPVEQAPEAEDYAEYLVGLARSRLAIPAAALGIGGRRSNLYRRITMLLQTREPLQRRCHARWNLGATLAALVLLAACAAVRLD